jgi:hypothetical protein
MKRTLVAIGLNAVIVFAPLAAMADSIQADHGKSHRRVIRYNRNLHKERA